MYKTKFYISRICLDLSSLSSIVSFVDTNITFSIFFIEFSIGVVINGGPATLSSLDEEVQCSIPGRTNLKIPIYLNLFQVVL